MAARYTSFPRLQRFNRECEFTVKRPISLGGVPFKAGDVLDKTLVTTRRLRQLHDQRYVVQGPVPVVGPGLPQEIDFAQLPTAAIIDWLRQRKRSPRPDSDRAGIINLARVVQEKEKAKAEAEKKEATDAVVSQPDTNGNSKRVQGKAKNRNPEAANA